MKSILDRCLVGNNLIDSAFSIEDLHHKCDDYLELKERKKGNGSAFVMQCQLCGAQRGGDIAKAKVRIKPPPFEPEIEIKYSNKYKELSNKALEASLNVDINYAFSGSLFSESIDEFLYDFNSEGKYNIQSIISSYLIRKRSSHIKEYKSSWKNENEISDWFESEFSKWFHIYREVWGQGYVNQKVKRVRIDFVLKAKKKLLDAGFTDQPIGVEVKYLDPREGFSFHGKSSKGVFQALSYWYSGARWDLGPENSKEELASVLILSNLSFSNDRDFIFGTYDSHYRKYWSAYLSIANHANVGELKIDLNERWGDSWQMHYSGTNYFSKKRDGTFKMGNSNVINKERIGNSS